MSLPTWWYIRLTPFLPSLFPSPIHQLKEAKWWWVTIASKGAMSAIRWFPAPQATLKHSYSSIPCPCSVAHLGEYKSPIRVARKWVVHINNGPLPINTQPELVDPFWTVLGGHSPRKSRVEWCKRARWKEKENIYKSAMWNGMEVNRSMWNGMETNRGGICKTGYILGH